jgi:hypothetical protein
MLRQILGSTRLDRGFCARLVGVTPEHFEEWLSGRRPVPRFVLPELSAILGAPAKNLAASPCRAFTRRGDSAALAPAIWYKLRDEKLTQADRELVGLVRKLGFYLSQLQAIRGGRLNRFEPLFRAIREKVDKSAPPLVQGRLAAQAFRGMTDIQHGQLGAGEWLRPTLRNLGVLVVESPLPGSLVEGCSFNVGTEVCFTPCVFANSYKSTWFRRNVILMHELGHAIFDLESEQVSVDYKDTAFVELIEMRAQAFAEESLVPRSVLIQFANRRGIRWNQISPEDLAYLVASCHVEASLVLKAAFEADLIDAEQLSRYSAYECATEVRRLTVPDYRHYPAGWAVAG